MALDAVEQFFADFEMSPEFVGCEEQFKKIVALRIDTREGVSVFVTDEWEARYVSMDICDAVCGFYEHTRPCHETRIRMALMWDDSQRLHNELSRIVSQEARPIILANTIQLALQLQRKPQLTKRAPTCWCPRLPRALVHPLSKH